MPPKANIRKKLEIVAKQGSANDRVWRAHLLRRQRTADRESSWQEWGKSNIKTASNLFRLNLARELLAFVKPRKTLERKKPIILEIGCGDGKLANDLCSILGQNAEFHATGLVRIEAWKKHSNSDNIKWHVCVGEKVNKIFKPGAVSFVISHFGLSHAADVKKAIQSACETLTPGGRILFTTQGSSLEGLNPPTGFFEIRPAINSTSENRCTGMVYYWGRKV